MRGIDSLRYSTALRQPAAYGGIMGRDGRRRYGLGSSFKKAFKSITKPIAKAVDKLIPNEIKPALPYIAAIAPFMVGPIGGLSLGASRALTAGLGSFITQAAPTGEVDNPFDIAAKAGLAYLTTPGAGDTIRSGTTAAQTGAAVDQAAMAGVDADALSAALDTQAKTLAERSLLTQAKDVGLESLAKVSDFIEVPEITGLTKGEVPLISKAGAQAVTVPLGITATEQAADAAQRELDEYNATLLANTELDKNTRVNLIRKYMDSAGFDESQITDALGRYGYLANGGRVGYQEGGDVSFEEFMRKKREEEFKSLVDKLMTEQGIQDKGYAFRLADDLMKMKRKNIDTDKLKFLNEKSALFALPKDMRPEPEYYDALKALKERVGYEEGGDVSYTDYERSGVIYMDQDGNPISKEKFLEETDKEEGIPSIRMKKKPKTLKDLLENPDAVKEMLRQNKKDGGLTSVKSMSRKKLMDALNSMELPEINASDYDNDQIRDILLDQAPDLFKMKDGGIMNLQGREMDLRGGGFVPIGAKERADDVPARLSKNEFVFTADAVRGAGNGDVDKGAQKMYNTMKMLEGKLA